MFVPADWICASIDVCAPVPSATMVMTAPTPMIMPSMVRAVRILFRPSALMAIRKIMRTDMRAPFFESLDRRRNGQRRQFVLRESPAGDRLVVDDETVSERHDARAVLRDVHFV